MRVARPVVLSTKQRELLKSHARARSAAARSVERARIVLLAASGMQDKQIAAKLCITPAQIQEVIRKTTQEKPGNATHWSTRSMAKSAGLSEKSVRRIWRQHGLKPHMMHTF